MWSKFSSHHFEIQQKFNENPFIIFCCISKLREKIIGESNQTDVTGITFISFYVFVFI